MSAAERGENRVHSRSVLKFQEAEVGVLVVIKGPFLLPASGRLRTLTFREKFILAAQLTSLLSPYRDMQYSSFLSLPVSPLS